MRLGWVVVVMRPKVSEIRKIASVLDQQWDDVEELAKTVLTEAFDMASVREQWVVIMQDKRLGTFVFGPFDTENKARKAIGTSIVSAGPEPASGVVRKVGRV